MNRATRIPRLVAARLGWAPTGLAMACVFALLGCHPDMWNQPRYKPLRESTFFEDGNSSRPRVPGTVAYEGKRRDWVHPVYAGLTGERAVPSVLDDHFHRGRDQNDEFVADNYFPITEELIARGQQRYNATCANCHGYAGAGAGIVVERGFPEPPSYHIDRLREVEDGYFYDVITNGFGRMYNLSEQVLPEDRWAIAAYLRALQASQYAPLEALPASAAEAAAANPISIPAPEDPAAEETPNVQ